MNQSIPPAGPHLSWSQHIIHVLQEAFIFDLIISKDKCDPLSLLTSSSVQKLEVLHQVAHIVRSINKEGNQKGDNIVLGTIIQLLGLIKGQKKKKERNPDLFSARYRSCHGNVTPISYTLAFSLMIDRGMGIRGERIVVYMWHPHDTHMICMCNLAKAYLIKLCLPELPVHVMHTKSQH